MVGGYDQHLAFTACQTLKWLSSQVPARVHVANVRFHFNGWHTHRRYQDRVRKCRFCDLAGTEDSIEHFVCCSWVNSCFPPHLKTGSPPRIPKSLFFLLGLGDDEKVAIAIFIYALYTICNEVRHSGVTSDLHLILERVMGEVYMKPAVLNTWRRIFRFRCEGRQSVRA